MLRAIRDSNLPKFLRDDVLLFRAIIKVYMLYIYIYNDIEYVYIYTYIYMCVYIYIYI